MKILVADDDADLLDVTTYALRREGYNIVTATDGQQAVDRHLDERPDLVLLDWVLPGIPGLSFARRLRANARTRDVPIVLLSARCDEQDKVAALEGGRDRAVAQELVALRLEEEVVGALVAHGSRSFLRARAAF